MDSQIHYGDSVRAEGQVLRQKKEKENRDGRGK